MKDNKAILIAYLSYIALGSFDGLLGVIWPAMSASLGVPLETLGVIAMVGLVGFVLVSFNAGALIKVRSFYWFLFASLGVRALAFAGIAFFPSWNFVILMIFVMSLGSGGLDAGLNIFFAAKGSPRQINWLHASFGIGATSGPFLAAAVQALGGPWEWNFAVIFAFMAVITILVWFTAPFWEIEPPTQAKQSISTKLTDSLKLPVIWISILLFFFYVGTEISAGQWSFTLFSLGRGMLDLSAKFWVGIYWGIFTLVRLLFGLIADKVRPSIAVRVALSVTMIGAGFLVWNPGGYGFVGLVVMGLAEAPIYPSLIAATIRRVGREHAPNAIGFQGAAGGVGGTSMTSLIGLLAVSFGFEMIAVAVAILACLTFLTHEVLLLASKSRQVPLA